MTEKQSLRSSHTHLQAAQSKRTDQSLQKSVPARPNKNSKFFSPTLKEKIKTPATQATTMQTDNKINSTADRHYIARTDRRAAGNSGFKKLAVQWLNQVQFFNQTFVVADSLVLRNHQLLKPAKRYAQL